MVYFDRGVPELWSTLKEGLRNGFSAGWLVG